MYALPILAKCNFTIVRFDLWMSKGVNDIFALVINFLGINWQPKHVTLWFFEGANISRKLWPKVWLSYLKSITQEGGGGGGDYVKDKGSNLNTMITALKTIISYDIFGLEESYQSTWFGHENLGKVNKSGTRHVLNLVWP